jgi:hypothetical protein
MPSPIAKELGDKIELQWKVAKIEKTDINNGAYKYKATISMKLPMECKP